MCSVSCLFTFFTKISCLFTGETDLMTQSYYNPSSSAHRRRTDLMPTITFSNASPASGISRASTPGTRMLTRSPGKAQSMSRLDALSKPRPLFTKHDPVATPTSTSKFSGTPKRQNVLSKNSPSPTATKVDANRRKMSQSMSHLAHTSPTHKKSNMAATSVNNGNRAKQGKWPTVSHKKHSVTISWIFLPFRFYVKSTLGNLCNLLELKFTQIK